MSAYLAAIALVVLGLYAYFAVAPGAASIPLQWGMGGGVNISAPRAIAFGLVPVVGLAAIIILSIVGAGATIAGIVLLLVQILHIVLVRNWYAKSRA